MGDATYRGRMIGCYAFPDAGETCISLSPQVALFPTWYFSSSGATQNRYLGTLKMHQLIALELARQTRRSRKWAMNKSTCHESGYLSPVDLGACRGSRVKERR